VDSLWATKSEGVGLIVRAFSFRDVVLIHQRHRRTDGRTDDMRSQDRALHYSTRAVKTGTTTKKLLGKTWHAQLLRNDLLWQLSIGT